MKDDSYRHTATHIHIHTNTLCLFSHTLYIKKSTLAFHFSYCSKKKECVFFVLSNKISFH